MGILPLGTGNDLSRVLGWGEGHSHEDVEVTQILDQLAQAVPVMLDRYNWTKNYSIPQIFSHMGFITWKITIKDALK